MDGQVKREKLGPLPASADDYFTKYDADTYQIKETKPKGCEHEFRYVNSQEIECEKCRMGLYLEVGDKLVDGHLYRNSKLVI